MLLACWLLAVRGDQADAVIPAVAQRRSCWQRTPTRWLQRDWNAQRNACAEPDQMMNRSRYRRISMMIWQ